MHINEMSILDDILEQMQWEQGLQSALWDRCLRCKGRGELYYYSVNTGELIPYDCPCCGGKGIISEGI